MKDIVACLITSFILLSISTRLSTASPSPSPIAHVYQNKRSGSSNLTQVYDKCSMEKSFTLTFDDGPGEFSTKLDETLSSNKARASFFLNGNNYGCIYQYADIMVKRFEAGHLLGSHTWSHVHLNQATYEQIHLQLELLEKAFIMILGWKPLWFRPPFGEYNDLVLQVLSERGYKGLVLWTEDSKDSATPAPEISTQIAAFNTYPPKTNLLNHETLKATALDVMPKALPNLVKHALKLVTVSECLGLATDPKEWYQYVGTPTPRNASWTCNGTPGPGKFA
ncbi:hypothetical protein CROQUDRAFT_667584 [Cronartium quercuum f. sp. fusiforme G11]|uniref:NodB homology domain-containing protein n=1 Tax=Cronartium quercuum f. sp. fusiforme G11 TaxID=708437 RepID=A0A9P6NXA1_9BASI|nr:hypothetical protein CROQUDRAFT_667584 [Cronartium quercuum f. sp. fusiforme G11]